MAKVEFKLNLTLDIPEGESKSYPPDATTLKQRSNGTIKCIGIDGDEYSELRQKAAAWDVVAEHPVIGHISSLPDDNTYADQVYARLDEIATEREPWDVLREAANYLDVPGRFDVSESVRGYADRLEREAAEKLQREREVKAVEHCDECGQIGMGWPCDTAKLIYNTSELENR